VHTRHLPGARPVEKTSGLLCEIPRSTEGLGCIFRMNLRGVLPAARFACLVRRLCQSRRLTVHDKGTASDPKARATGLQQDAANIGMNRKIDACCLDVPSLRVGLPNRTYGRQRRHQIGGSPGRGAAGPDGGPASLATAAIEGRSHRSHRTAQAAPGTRQSSAAAGRRRGRTWQRGDPIADHLDVRRLLELCLLAIRCARLAARRLRARSTECGQRVVAQRPHCAG